MKKYIVEFTHTNGTVEEVEFTTDKIEWTIGQWARNRSIRKAEIISEGTSNTKQMLLG